MNAAMDYPAHLPATNSSGMERAVPQFQVTRRYVRLTRQNSAKRLLRKILGKPELSPEEFLKAVGVPSAINGPTVSGTAPDAGGQ
jgi:hypothetical protein